MSEFSASMLPGLSGTFYAATLEVLFIITPNTKKKLFLPHYSACQCFHEFAMFISETLPNAWKTCV